VCGLTVPGLKEAAKRHRCPYTTTHPLLPIALPQAIPHHHDVKSQNPTCNTLAAAAATAAASTTTTNYHLPSTNTTTAPTTTTTHHASNTRPPTCCLLRTLTAYSVYRIPHTAYCRLHTAYYRTHRGTHRALLIRARPQSAQSLANPHDCSEGRPALILNYPCVLHASQRDNNPS